MSKVKTKDIFFTFFSGTILQSGHIKSIIGNNINNQKRIKYMNTENTTKINMYDFNDVKGVKIPLKIKCSKCGREIIGYHKLIWKRVMENYNGEWLRYQAEWKCGICKKDEKSINKPNDKYNLTELEKQVISAMRKDEFYGDFGYNTTLWGDSLADTVCWTLKIKRRTYAGVMSSLNKKGILQSSGTSREGVVGFTEKGIEYIKEVFGEQQPE